MPNGIKQQQFLNAYIFGSVCPRNGKTEALVVPFSNKEGVKLHMEQISKATPLGRHSVVIIDGASWHTENVVDAFDNVSIINYLHIHLN